MRYVPLLFSMLVMASCTLPQTPTPETLPETPPSQMAQFDVLRQEVQMLRQRMDALDGRIESLEPLTARMARFEALLMSPTPTTKKTRGKGYVPRSAAQVVSIAQQEARVEPSPVGYYAHSAEQVYTYSPGRIYTILLSWNHPTLLFLPPTEKLVMGLTLDPDQYDVKNETAGSGLTAYDAISIRPKFEKGETQAFILTESARRYLLRLVIGEVGMLAVTFEIPHITQTAPEPKLILPRPQQ